MAHTFSSLSPKHQNSAQTESKKMLSVAANASRLVGVAADDQQSFINPFSIACRKDSEENSQGEVTAEGFFKNPEESPTRRREETSATVLSTSSPSRNAS